jgi:monoamine oxidase
MGMSTPEPLRDQVDVVIVGAGIAGLAAARGLVRAGIDVQLVEARDRVGGRAVTRTVGRGRFDLGGQWMGPGQHRLAALATGLGAATFPTHHAGGKLLDDRGRIRRYQGDIPRLPPWELLELHRALRRLDAAMVDVPVEDPAAARNAAALDERTVADWAGRLLPSRRMRALFEASLGAVFGASSAEMSLLWFLAYLRAGGGLMKLVGITGGAQQDRFVDGAGGLAEAMAAGLGDRVALAAPVRRIAQRGGAVDVVTDRGTVRARRAIVAVPPPLAARIDFDPLLPARRDQLLQRAAMGAIIKVVACYERPFWRDRGLSGEVVATAPDPFAVVFDNSSHDLAQPALLGFIVGDRARIFGALPAADRQRAATAALARWFGAEAAHPTAIAELDWAAEAWTRGCPVAAVAPGALTRTGGGLRAPVGAVHWAGTETATEWTGYFEGALESAERVVREVMRAL